VPGGLICRIHCEDSNGARKVCKGPRAPRNDPGSSFGNNRPAGIAAAFNAQIGHEYGAGLQYVAIAAHFKQHQLTLLAKLFFAQAEEETQHAMKFIQYMLDTKGDLKIPAIQAPKATFKSAEEAVQAALNWEQDVTRQITALMDIAVKENDYLSQSFLQWFIDEQLEEVVKMDRLLSVIRKSGERNLLMVEAYLIHIEKAS
jgi:ferritin